MKRFLQNPLSVVGAILVFLVVGISLSASWLPLPDPAATALSERLLTPGSPGHWLGTDLLGRDILSRLIWGTRLSVAVALAATLLAAFIGSSLGLVAGYFGRRTDALLMRSIDMMMAFPYLLLALAIVATLGPGLFNALVAIAIVNIPFFARTVRGVTVGLVKRDFVDTARMSGCSELRILVAEILPNVFPVIVITMASTLGWMILETAGLSFLGLGAQPPQADLGSMLGDGRKLLLIKPHLALLPGVVVFVLVMGINLLGDGIRDALDPRLSPGAAGRPSAATLVESSSEPSQPTGTAVTGAEGKLLQVRNLSVSFGPATEAKASVRGVDFSLEPGGTLGLVGESGSGKSVTALSLMRLLPSPPATLSADALRFDGEDLLQAPVRRLRALRGNRVAYVFQDPLTSLNPMFTAGDQIAEALRLHRACSYREAWREAVELLDALQIPRASARARSYPRELSGGMRQRVSIAMALANQPDLLIADEPTTALDVTVQRTVMDLLRERIVGSGTALLFISHDLALVSELCEQILVMKKGEVVERGSAVEVLNQPDHPYTRELLASLPSLERPAPDFNKSDEDPPLVVKKLSREFGSRKRGFFGPKPEAIQALKDVSLSIPARSIFGIVGESGSGKSTLARILCGLLPASAGEIFYEGDSLSTWMNTPRRYRKELQIVFQDPASSLNPRLRIRTLLEQPLKNLAGDDPGTSERLEEILAEMGMPPDALDRHPHEFSGGQAQRIGIARALVAGPKVLILDEAVSALDVSVQARILELLNALRKRYPLTIVFISHDLAVVREFCTHVAVLRQGHLEESGTNEKVFANPASAYTRSLLASAPRLRTH